jgi:hypothetical protein
MREDGNGTVAAPDTAQRGTTAVIEDHLRLRREGDLEEDIRRNYRADVVILTPSRTYHGHDGVRECAGRLYKAIQDAEKYEYSSVVCDERTALLEWSASDDGMTITDGVDSFLVEDGKICVQTIRYTVTFRELSQAHSVG